MRFIALGIAVIISLSSVSYASSGIGVHDDLDRNAYTSSSSDDVLEDIPETPDESDTPDTPDTPDISDDESEEAEEQISLEAVRESEERKNNTNFIDSVIFSAGLVILAWATIYATMYGFYRVAPGQMRTITRTISFGKWEYPDESVTTFVIKFLVIIAIGTLFITGYFKVAVVKILGWFLTL